MRWPAVATLATAGLLFPGVMAAQTCPALRWTTLGTAGGPVPTAERAEPANLLVAANDRILVDTGDGAVDQMAKIGLTLGAVRTVLISHLHLDHAGGLGAVIGLRWMNQFPGVLTVYGPRGTRMMVDGILASMAPAARIGFGLGPAVQVPSPAASVAVVEVKDGARFALGEMDVRAVANSHFDQADGSHDPDSVSLSYRFELSGRSIVYTGDTGPSAAVEHLAKGADLLVSEVIDLDPLIAEIRARRADAPPQMFEQMSQHLRTHHLVAADVGAMAARAGVARIVLTHFAIPGPLADSEPALRAGVRRIFAGPVDLARDLASFDLDCSRTR